MGNMTPGFEFQHSGEIIWCHVRSRLQEILQFDEEWVVDTPRSETLWAETCQQNDIARGSAADLKTARAASGPIGFTWWGWLLPQHVEIVPTSQEGIWRLRSSVTLGRVAQGALDDAVTAAHACQSFVLGGALIVGDDDVLRMVFSLGLDASMAEEMSQFAAGLLHRQVAYSGYVADILAGAGVISLTPEHHPTSGPREVPDEFVRILFEGAMPSAPPTLDSGRPTSPEGLCLTRVFSQALPSLVEAAIGWRHRPGIGEGAEVVFSNDAVDDPYTYFAFLPIEITNDRPPLGGHVFPFKNDPHLRLRMQIADVETAHYSTRLEALLEANRRLWLAWSNASANIMGCFTPVESPAGFYPGQTFVLWPAASLPHVPSWWKRRRGPQDLAACAETIAHLWMHVGDQTRNV